jgi:hypothetical protein
MQLIIYLNEIFLFFNLFFIILIKYKNIKIIINSIFNLHSRSLL